MADAYHPKPTPLRYCQQCGVKLERKRFRNKRLESLNAFNIRKFCTWKCLREAYIERPAEFGMKGRG